MEVSENNNDENEIKLQFYLYYEAFKKIIQLQHFYNLGVIVKNKIIFV